MTSWVCGPRISAREVQPSSTGSKAPRSRGAGSGCGRRRAAWLQETVLTLLNLGADRPQTGASVAQRQTSPPGQVTIIGGRVADQIATRKLGEGAVAIDRLVLPEPVANQGIGVLLADHRPAHGDSSHRGEEEKVDHRLALGAHAQCINSLAQLDPAQRALLGQRALDR